MQTICIKHRGKNMKISKYLLLLAVGIVFFISHLYSAELGDIIKPHLHINAAIGDSTGDPETLSAGHHDPTREDLTVQGIEAGFSFRYEDYLQGFVTYNFSYGASEEWEDEFEEGFLKLLLPDMGFELRGGRILSRIGLLNPKHLHSWNFVDMPLVMGRFLGDDGLIKDGGDVTWSYGDEIKWVVMLGYGKAKSHDDHGHGEEGHDDHHGEEHHDEHESEEHHHAHDEGVISDDVFTSKIELRFTPNDFHHYSFGISGIQGENGTKQDTTIFALDFNYTWREKGLERGGRGFTWNTEFYQRKPEYIHDEHDDEDHHEHEDEHEEHHEEILEEKENGFYTELIYTHNAHFDYGIRYGQVEGIEKLEVDERVRWSANVTYAIDEARHYLLRLQYNHDDLKDHGTKEKSWWLQGAISFGGPEVR